MQGDRNGVTQMTQEEILTYTLYQNQRHAANGLTRDHLPYTGPFDQMLAAYNQQANHPLNEREFWRQLVHVLKYGEQHIDNFLAAGAVAS